MLNCLAVGAQARLMSAALRKIAANASKCNVTVIFINQLRHKVPPASFTPEGSDSFARNVSMSGQCYSRALKD